MPEVTQESMAPAVELRTPRRPSAEAESLAAKIERAVRRGTGDKVRGLKVDVFADRIVLDGRCGTYYCKQLAQHAAMPLVQQARLINMIEVW